MRRRRSSACCKAYLAHRAAPEETFLAFARRHDVEALKLADAEAPHDQMTLPRHPVELLPETRRSRPSSAPGSTASSPACSALEGGVDGAVAGAMRRADAGCAGAGDGDDGEAPWHDQAMPLAERMKLAEGRPLRRRMMAAMAQQDCGQCGYNCEDYSDAHR